MLILSRCLAMLLLFAATDDPTIKEFNDHVQQYWDLHKKVESSLPSLDKEEPSPAVILDHEKKLRAGIQQARKGAAEGDVFTPAQKVLATTIQQQIAAGKRAGTKEKILGEGNPRNPEEPAKVVLAVNGQYPAAAPLSTVPPSVLLSLPKLPQGLEYRFVGKHLILFDSKANLIVDILRNSIR